MHGRVLIVAGSDSGGGAGIQADIKTVTALCGFAMTAVTALTAQSTLGVSGVYPVPPAFVAQQMRVVLGDLGADVIKLGMLHDAAVIDAVAGVLCQEGDGLPLVVDPVMVAKGGASLLQREALDALVRRILPLATLITPNLPEAEALLGRPITSVADMRAAAGAIQDLGPGAVLMKGGHLEGDTVTDVLRLVSGDTHVFEAPRLVTRSTHGTGCTLASAIAVGLAQKLALPAAVARAHDYVLEAIRTAPGFGRGHGPLNHAHTVTPTVTPTLTEERRA